MVEALKNLVGGEWVGGRSNNWFEDRNPADDDVVALFPAMDAGDLDRVLETATEGFEAWKRTRVIERGLILFRCAGIIRSRAEEMARGVSQEVGKTLKEARVEVEKTADFFDYYGSFGRFPLGELLPDARPGVTVQVHREPVGVVVAITPWNDPVLTPARKLGPALISGNSVILKPSPDSPLSAWLLTQVLHEAGVPAGVVNVVTGDSSEVAEALLARSGLGAVTFTGSSQVGRAVERQLAGRNIRLQTEMGAKNAVVVMADANLALATEAIVAGAFAQAGQRCTATSRIIVHATVEGALLDRLVDRAKNIRVGPGLDEATDMGPVVSNKSLEAICRHLDQARLAGADVLSGGERLQKAPYDRGHFMAPTIIMDVKGSATWREEIFGPVGSVLSAEDLDEAIRLVNDSAYGLSASIFTRDLENAARFADGVETGCVGVNLPTAGWDVHVPFGGFKDSGSAFKEQGRNVLEFYTRSKTVAVKDRGL